MGQHWPGLGFQNPVPNYLLGFYSLTCPNKFLIFHDDYSPHTWICSSLEFLISINTTSNHVSSILNHHQAYWFHLFPQKSQTCPLLSHSVVPLSHVSDTTTISHLDNLNPSSCFHSIFFLAFCLYYAACLEKEMATHSSVLAWRIPGTGSLVGCHLWGRTESDMTEVT